MVGKYKVITLCGSTRFKDAFMEAQKRLTLEGNIIISYEVPCSFSSVILSSPEMKLGETYTVVIGDTVEEITLNVVSASYGDAQSEGFGGNMNWGIGM